MRTLRENSRKLTTPFDINETLKSFLNFNNEPTTQFKSKTTSKNEPLPRGFSLLDPIPTSRTCANAHIESHWCSCLNWIDIEINKIKRPKINKTKDEYKTPLQVIHQNLENNYSKLAIELGRKAVEFINSLIDKEFRKYCEELLLKSIERVSR